MITPVLENYLKTILKLNKGETKARVTNLSKIMHVSKPTASQNIKRLMKQSMVRKQANGVIVLTDSGRTKAIEIRNRNLLIKDFLTKILGVDKETSEKDACSMEHLLSCETLGKIETYLHKAK